MGRRDHPAVGQTDRFEASFLPSAGEALNAVCNVDVEVTLTADDSRWSATVFTLAEVERLMETRPRTGEAGSVLRVIQDEQGGVTGSEHGLAVRSPARRSPCTQHALLHRVLIS
jgi:hypothetical protein